MDKTCIGFAAVMDIQQDYHIVKDVYSWTTWCFYFANYCSAITENRQTWVYARKQVTRDPKTKILQILPTSKTPHLDTLSGSYLVVASVH